MNVPVDPPARRLRAGARPPIDPLAAPSPVAFWTTVRSRPNLAGTTMAATRRTKTRPTATRPAAKPAARRRTSSSTHASPAAKPARRTATPPVVTPPQRARVEYAALLREIDDAGRDELRGWDRKWEAVATVLQKRYFLLDDDTPTGAAWVKKHLGEEYRTVQRNARVARLASPAEEAKYTVTKIDLAYSIDATRRLAAAKKKGVDGVVAAAPERLDLAALRYTVVRSGKKLTLGLDAITAPELRALLSGKTSAHGAPPHARLSPRATRIQRTLAAHPELRNVTLREHENALTIDQIRLDQVHALGRALSRVDLGRDES